MSTSRARSLAVAVVGCSVTATALVADVADARPAPIEDQPIAGAPVVINEIMFDPSAVYDSRGEWIELHNTTGAAVDLDGWTIGDETYDRHTIQGVTIASGASRHCNP